MTARFFPGIISYQLFGIIKIKSLPFSIVLWLASPAFGNWNRYQLILNVYGAAHAHCFLAIFCCIELSLRLLNLLENINKNLSCFNNRYLIEEDRSVPMWPRIFGGSNIQSFNTQTQGYNFLFPLYSTIVTGNWSAGWQLVDEGRGREGAQWHTAGTGWKSLWLESQLDSRPFTARPKIFL